MNEDFISALHSAHLSQLKSRDVRVARGTRRTAAHIKGMEKQRERRLRNDLRLHFFRLAWICVFLMVGTSIALVIGVAFFDADISDTIAIAFMSGLAVETVGVLIVMAGYFFPSRKRA